MRSGFVAHLTPRLVPQVERSHDLAQTCCCTAGVDWKAVKNETDMTDQLSGLLDQLYSSDSKRKLKT